MLNMAGPSPGAPSTKQMSPEMALLREYVMDPGMNVPNQSEDTVRVSMKHSLLLTTNFPDIRLSLHLTIAELKHKVYTHVGVKPEMSKLELQDVTGRKKGELSDMTRKLGYYSPEDGDVIFVHDLDPCSLAKDGWLDDTSKVEKYEMSKEDYIKRPNAVPNIRQQRMEADPDLKARFEAKQKKHEEMEKKYPVDSTNGIEVGKRCWCSTASLRGKPCTVRYIGEVVGLPGGYWVGIECDDPCDGHSGSYNGKSYFKCVEEDRDDYGKFVRPDVIEIADIPTLAEELAGSDGEL